MKNAFAIFLFLLSTCVYSQTVMADPSTAKPKTESTSANFPSGNLAFQQLLAKNFNGRNVECEISGSQSTMIEFTVEKDGTVSEITSKGSNQSLNTEAVRVVKSINMKWNPATSGGENIRSKMSQPFKFMCD